MAFDVTPTSGNAPYNFTASFLNKSAYDSGLFSVEFRQATEVGMCPVDALAGTNNAPIALELFNNEAYSYSTGNVPAGSCRTYSLLIRRLSDNVVESIMSVTVDNIV